MNTPKRFLKSPKPFFRCSGNIPSMPLQRAVVGAQTCGRWGSNVRSLGLKRAVVGAQTCSRWGSNVQSLELDRAVDSLPSYYSMPGHCTHDLYEAVQAFQEV